jgi:hypothetical protein
VTKKLGSATAPLEDTRLEEAVREVLLWRAKHVPDDILDQIADLSCVPQRYRSALKKGLRRLADLTIICSETIWTVTADEKRAHEKLEKTNLRRIAKAARSLIAAMEKASIDTLMRLETAATTEAGLRNRPPQTFEEFADARFAARNPPSPLFPDRSYRAQTRLLAKLSAVAAATPEQQNLRRPPSLQRLIEALYVKIVVRANGKLTLWQDLTNDTNDRLMGTLPGVLRLLRPFMPDTVPRNLNFSMLQRPLAAAKRQFR